MHYLATVSFTLATLFSAAVQAQSSTLLQDYTPVSLSELQDPPASDWLMWRRTANHWGYSPLDQIDRDNVTELEVLWT